MAMNPETYQEFQREIELQKVELESENDRPKVKVDEDGTEYEWDEAKKAWFPKLSVELMLKYQSNYASEEGNNEEQTKSSTYTDPITKITYEWNSQKNRWDPQSTDNGPCKYMDPTGTAYVWNQEHGKWDIDPENSKTDNNKATEDDAEKVNENYSNEAHEYTDPKSGVKYKWNPEKRIWMSDDGQIMYPSSKNSTYTDPSSKKQYTWNNEKQIWEENKAEKKKKKKGTEASKRKATDPTWFQVEEDKNTNVYVQGLPPDINLEEFASIMSKCGIIMPNPHTGQPKLKLYKDKEGNLKGDGLCCYLKKESLDLALQLLDDKDVRGGYRIHVQKANFELKGSYDASKKPKMLSKKEKMKIQKQREKLLDWKLARQEAAKKTERVLIFKNMFDPEEFEADAVLITEIRDDLKGECEKFGQVKKVLVFDRHPDGVCSVSFKDHDEATKCHVAMNGRWFGGKRIDVSVWDGVTDYQVEETDKEREARMKNWENFLEN